MKTLGSEPVFVLEGVQGAAAPFVLAAALVLVELVLQGVEVELVFQGVQAAAAAELVFEGVEPPAAEVILEVVVLRLSRRRG